VHGLVGMMVVEPLPLGLMIAGRVLVVFMIVIVKVILASMIVGMVIIFRANVTA